jgi:hypothetical protein
MNRGIGITGFPIRLGARPEITLLELVRGVRDVESPELSRLTLSDARSAKRRKGPDMVWVI